MASICNINTSVIHVSSYVLSILCFLLICCSIFTCILNFVNISYLQSWKNKIMLNWERQIEREQSSPWRNRSFDYNASFAPETRQLKYTVTVFMSVCESGISSHWDGRLQFGSLAFCLILYVLLHTHFNLEKAI